MDEITPDQEIDLRGEVCPYTFVKTKLALEMMHPGIGQEGNVSAFQEIAREIKCFLDTSHDPVGVQILEGTERAGVPAAPRRFCILEREDLAGDGPPCFCTRHTLKTYRFDLRRMAGVGMGQTSLVAGWPVCYDGSTINDSGGAR